ncbi:MAG TPA: ATPase [Candidatus Hydrogenedentes bacterium]|nr:ATPase [Candidatus Hydrogenedentota bacterium]
MRALGIALAAALCVAGGAFATGRAQSAIGAGGTGAMAEKPELFGRVFILVALPETMVVLGFVLGIVIALNL